ncbi:MAG: hypothetical protein ABIH00_02095 [Armatimonadota bacterium]
MNIGRTVLNPIVNNLGNNAKDSFERKESVTKQTVGLPLSNKPGVEYTTETIKYKVPGKKGSASLTVKSNSADNKKKIDFTVPQKGLHSL